MNGLPREARRGWTVRRAGQPETQKTATIFFGTGFEDMCYFDFHFIFAIAMQHWRSEFC